MADTPSSVNATKPSVALVKQIARMGRDANDRPYRPVKINHIIITKGGAPAAKPSAASAAKPAVKKPAAPQPLQSSAGVPLTSLRTGPPAVGRASCPRILKRKESMARQPGTYAIFNTSEGTIVCRLFEKEAPKTVANFIDLAEGKREWTHPVSRKKSKDRLYDGTIFHRVIPDFMIQGGDPAGTGFGGPGYQFEDETKGSPHSFDKPGKLAMANSGPNTNGSQFFITIAPTQWLTGKHTIFGEVVEGYEVAEKIVATPRNRQDKPVKDAVVKSVTIERI